MHTHVYFFLPNALSQKVGKHKKDGKIFNKKTRIIMSDKLYNIIFFLKLQSQNINTYSKSSLQNF